MRAAAAELGGGRHLIRRFASVAGCFTLSRRCMCSAALCSIASPDNEQSLVVIGGGAAGIYASIQAKSLAPALNVIVFEKGKFLSKVKISGGGRCNVTNGHFFEPMTLAENYPRGNKELRGSYFKRHGPKDTVRWFVDHGVSLKTEDDGRVFPVSNDSLTIVDCLLSEARRVGVSLQAGKVVSSASVDDNGKFILKLEKRSLNLVETIESTYVLVATGSSSQGFSIAKKLGHSVIDPVPSLFTFKIAEKEFSSLSGVTFGKVRAKLNLDGAHSSPEFTQIGPMLVTHWGLSGPVILRLSAWGAREFFRSEYAGMLCVDFLPDIRVEDVKAILCCHKNTHAKNKMGNSFPSEFGLVKRFWKFLLETEGMDGDVFWASVSSNNINAIAHRLKEWSFKIAGKGQFKDEFVTAGGVPLTEISLKTMESNKVKNLFFAGEILNVDGITGGFNFQNAWTGGYIAGTSIGTLAAAAGNRSKLQVSS